MKAAMIADLRAVTEQECTQHQTNCFMEFTILVLRVVSLAQQNVYQFENMR